MTDLDSYMFQHLQQLLNKYNHPVKDDLYWQSLIADAGWVVNQYKDTDLAILSHKLVLDILQHLEEKFKSLGG